MSEKKLVIKLKYGASAPHNKKAHLAQKQPQYSWNYRRIAFSFGAGLIVLALLFYGFFSEEPNGGAGGGSAESGVSTGSAFDSSRAPDRRTDSLPSDGKLGIEESQSSSGPGTGTAITRKVPQENLPVDDDLYANRGADTAGFADGSRSKDGAKIMEPQQAKSENILRAQFTWGIKNKEPTGRITSPAILQPGSSVALYFFSEFGDLKGQTVSHEWNYNGRVAITRNFKVRGNRWRVFSSKQLNSKFLGAWKVTIRNSNGENLGEFGLDVLEPTRPSR